MIRVCVLIRNAADPSQSWTECETFPDDSDAGDYVDMAERRLAFAMQRGFGPGKTVSDDVQDYDIQIVSISESDIG